jgi:CRISPR/Cas system-associated endonuclease Cas3-HD
MLQHDEEDVLTYLMIVSILHDHGKSSAHIIAPFHA